MIEKDKGLMNDRRKTGVNRVLISDGNGGKLDVYTATASRIKVWASAIGSIFFVLGLAFGAARLGVGFEIHQAIDEECDPPNGVIYKEIESMSKEFLEEVQAVLQDDLDVFDERFEKQEADLKAQHEIVIRLDERQIAMEKARIEDKDDLIREIRRAGGNG